MAKVRTAFGHDRFDSGIEGVPPILPTDVDVPDDLLEALGVAAESADIMLVVDQPTPDLRPPDGVPTTVINLPSAEQLQATASTSAVLPATEAGEHSPPPDADTSTTASPTSTLEV